MKKRLLPLLLTIALSFTLLPAGAWAATGDIAYIDADGNTQTLTSGSYTEVTGGEIEVVIDSGTHWYVVKNDATIDKINVNQSDVCLIICDGATLTVEKRIDVVESNGKLTIYGQSQGTGRININGDTSVGYAAADIRAIRVHEGTLTINGGNITARCPDYVNTENLTLQNYGLHVRSGASVVLNGGSLTVSGGNITSTKAGATGGSCGIKCEYGGAIKVNGGTLKATGGSVSMGDTGNREEWDIDGSLNISGGEVKGKDAQGVLMKGDLNVSGGTLKLRGGSLPKVQSGTTIDPASLLPEGYAYHDTDGNPVPLGEVEPTADLTVKPCAHKKTDGTLLSINGVCSACRHVCPHPDGYTDGLCSICGAAAPVTGGDTTLRYTGGNSFATSRAQIPLSVEIDGTPVAFVGDGSSFTVSCLDPGARWVTVRWQGASVTARFTPDANAYCTEIAIPKTGDMPLWAAVAEWLGL